LLLTAEDAAAKEGMGWLAGPALHPASRTGKKAAALI
jgi:hypothetical protein